MLLTVFCLLNPSQSMNCCPPLHVEIFDRGTKTRLSQTVLLLCLSQRLCMRRRYAKVPFWNRYRFLPDISTTCEHVAPRTVEAGTGSSQCASVMLRLKQWRRSYLRTPFSSLIAITIPWFPVTRLRRISMQYSLGAL